MKRLLVLSALCFALLAAIPAMSLGGKGKIGTEDTCAAVLGVEDASACGNQIYAWIAISSSPYGGSYIGTSFGPCYSNQQGYITYVWNYQYLYTVQCRQI